MDPITGAVGLRLAEALDLHTDPVLREIGQQLTDGAAPHELLMDTRFAEVVEHGLKRLDEACEVDRVQLAALRFTTPTPVDSHPDDGGVPAGRR